MKRVFLLEICCLVFCSGCMQESASVLSPSETIIEETVDEFQMLFNAFYSDGDSLPAEDYDGHPLTYQILEGNAIINDGVIYKTDNADEYESIVLSVNNTVSTVTVDNILLLDPIVGYVIAYFTSEGTDEETLKLAYTYNGTYWFKINNDEGVLAPDSGTKKLRDPSFVRKKDGSFVLLATQSYNNPSIYVLDTDDFITYTNERLVQVNSSSDTLTLNENQAWAPEGYYNRVNDTYYLYWSSTDDGGMFYNTTRDFETYSYPDSFLEVGFTIIDATMAQTENGFTWIYKDEREPMSTHAQLYRSTTASFTSQPSQAKLLYKQRQLEGPMIMKCLDKEGYYLFADCYTFQEFKGFYVENIETGILQEIPEDENYLIPLEKPSHASAIAVTWKELERLMNATFE